MKKLILLSIFALAICACGKKTNQSNSTRLDDPDLYNWQINYFPDQYNIEHDTTSRGNFRQDLRITPGGAFEIKTSNSIEADGFTIDSSTIADMSKTTAYSGTTNSSGVYTVTFASPYPVAPNIQANVVNQSSTDQFLRITSVSTTGFTINVFQRSPVTLLGISLLPGSVTNVTSASVDVLITKK